MITPSLKLFRHLLMNQPTLPVMPGPIVFVFAHNGVYLWARRTGLEVLVPYQRCIIPDLYPVESFIRLDGVPRVDSALLEYMLDRGSHAHREDGVPVETLFFLRPQEAYWVLSLPPQKQEPTRVAPVKELLDMDEYAHTLIEVHTHPLSGMAAFYSQVDNEDEIGFRLYGVIGRIAHTPTGVEAEIRMRVCVYKWASFEFPASQVMCLPRGLRECLTTGNDVSFQKEGRRDEPGND